MFDPFRLAEVLSLSTVDLSLSARTPTHAISLMMEMAASTGRVRDRLAAFEVLIEREALESTAFTVTPAGNVLAAVPHAKTEAVSDVVVVLGRFPDGVDFRHPSGVRVEHIALVLGPPADGTRYLQALATTIWLYRTPGFAEALAGAAGPDEAILTVAAWARRLNTSLANAVERRANVS